MMRYAAASFVLLSWFLVVGSSEYKLNLPPPQAKYKFLMLLPFSSQSHRNCFLPLAEALGDRGHQVVLVSPLPPKAKHPNVREVSHGINLLANHTKTLFEIRDEDATGGFAFFEYALPYLLSKMYEIPEVKELYAKRHEFDFIILDELFSEPGYPFIEGRKYGVIGTAGMLPESSALLGNVFNPSYVPSVGTEYPRPYTFYQRVSNLFWHIYFALYWRNLNVVPAIQKMASEKFPDLPPLLEMQRNGLSLILANTHFSIDAPMPNLPSQIEVGGMHCFPGKKLPQDLNSWIEGAGSAGVVYFSLGSVCEGKTIPDKYKKVLLEAFGKLKQRVIWKFEDELEGLPKNVIIRKWLPQQDILAHPNVKLFITHGGLLSMQEAVYHATPLLALPVFGDQSRNAMRIRNKGFGTFLIWEDLTVDLVVSTIQELINNKKYTDNISSTSVVFRDQPRTPLETAIWWIEYVTRHKGAPQLKSPGADLSWIEYLMIDVLLFIYFIIFILYWITKKIIRAVWNVATKGRTPKRDKRKKE